MSAKFDAELKEAVRVGVGYAGTCRHSGDAAGAAAIDNLMKIYGARIRQESNDPTSEVPVISVCSGCGGPALCANCGGPT